MIPSVIGGSIGLMVGGPLAALVGVSIPMMTRRIRVRNRRPQPPIRLVLMLLLIELRSGLSVLAALQEVSRALPDEVEVRRVARLATVMGLTGSIGQCHDTLRPILAQLARAQRSGASLTATVRRMLEQDLARQRSERLAKSRSLPVRLMLPVTLLMLPGLVLFLYAPSLLGMFDDLVGTWN